MCRFENMLMPLLGNGANLFKTVYICFGLDCLFFSAKGFLERKKVPCAAREAFSDARKVAAQRRKTSGTSDRLLRCAGNFREHPTGCCAARETSGNIRRAAALRGKPAGTSDELLRCAGNFSALLGLEASASVRLTNKGEKYAIKDCLYSIN